MLLLIGWLSALVFYGNGFAAERSLLADAKLEAALALDQAGPDRRDAAEVAQRYREAADAGSAIAQWRLGYLYEVGSGVPQDYREARLRYEAAVAGGLEEARLRLAICHLEGWGGPKDRDAFVREIRAAAEANQVPAQNILSSLYFTGYGVAIDRAKGMEWLQRAAEQDDAWAQVGLGNEVRKLMDDAKLSRSWYQLSAEQEHSEGMRAMARSFLTGNRADRNWELGIQWLELASKTGDPEAPYLLALNEVLNVDAKPADESQAMQNLELAAARGNSLAKEVLMLNRDGSSLRDALRKTLNTPYTDRYLVQAKANVEAKSKDGRRMPEIYRVVRPIYPMSLRLTRETGEALIEFVVDSKGRVQNAKVISATHPLFGERAIDAVRQWKFYPGTVDGRLVNTRMSVPLYFKISENFAGVDAMIGDAYDLALTLGPEVEADARDLHVAKSRTRLQLPHKSDGSPIPPQSKVLGLLVLDASGHPIRGHKLRAEPAEIGSAFLASWMAATFEPRFEGNKPVSSNVVIGYVATPGDAVFK